MAVQIAESVAPPVVELNELTTDPFWFDDAECNLKVAPDLSTGGRQGPGSIKPNESERYSIATRCAMCDVREICLADAVLKEADFGIRGGLLAGQVKPLIKAHNNQGITTETWEAALGQAEVVRDEYLAEQAELRTKPRRVHRPPVSRSESAEQIARVSEYLARLPDSMAVIGEDKRSIFDEIAGELGFETPQVRRIVARMVVKGLVEREDGNHRLLALRLVR